MDAQQLQMVNTKGYNIDDQVLQEINNGQTDEGLAVIARHSDEHNNIEIKQEKINQNKNQFLTIVTTIFIAYSAIVSTIALILALNSNSTTLPSATSCDCSLQSFAAKQDPITSGFCDLIDQCIALETAEPTFYPSTDPSNYPSNYPSKYPSNYPSKHPSLTLSKFPSTSPTLYPTLEPTLKPTINPSSINPSTSPTSSPTEYYEKYDHFVGDYKVSAQNESHGAWKLCDGAMLHSADYILLFEELGYRFGSDSNNSLLFALPFIPSDGEEIGMIAYFDGPCPSGWDLYSGLDGRFPLGAGTYSLGINGGESEHTLSLAEIPSHNHIIAGVDTTGAPNVNGNSELGNVDNYPSYNSRSTSSSGGNGAHNNMPPYLVLNACQKIKAYRGNTFIYTA